LVLSVKLAAGESLLAPEAGDRRFADPTWRESAIYSGLLQSCLALRPVDGAIRDIGSAKQ
jgi:hypothetical protein